MSVCLVGLFLKRSACYWDLKVWESSSTAAALSGMSVRSEMFGATVLHPLDLQRFDAVPPSRDHLT